MPIALYPIRKDSIDKQLYLLVKTVMMIRSVKAYQHYAYEFPGEEQLNIKQLSYQLKNYHAFLIFPSLHKQFRFFSQEITKYPVVIAVYKTNYALYTTNGHNHDTYQLDSFYTLDVSGNNTSSLNLTQHEIGDFYKDLPVFYNNTREFVNSIDGLLKLLSKYHLEKNDWYKRLQDARRLLVEGEDGMYILHTVGLFDGHFLRLILLSSQVDEQELNDVLQEFTDNLKIFTMLVINGVYEVTYNYQRNVKKDVVKPGKKNVTPSKSPIPSPSRWHYRQDVLNSKNNQPTYQELEAAKACEDKEKLREENNRRIIKNVIIYAVLALVFVGALMLAKYSIKGSATISIGVISAIIMRNIQRLKEGFEPKDPQPRWFVVSLIYACIILVFGGMLVCKWLSTYVCTISDGSITPWGLFGMVFALMTGLFIYSIKVRKQKKGKDARIYIFLMAFSVSMSIAQCTGSLSATSDIDQKEWEKSNEEWEKSNEEWKRKRYNEKIVGKWLLNLDVLGKIQVEEEFFADGTWQRVKEDSLVCKGEWKYIGNDQIKIWVLWSVPAASLSTSDFIQTLKIDLLCDDKFICKKGEYYITRTRKKDEVNYFK